MRCCVLFILAACSAPPNPHGQLAAPTTRFDAATVPVPDIVAAPRLGIRGDSCTKETSCAEDLACAPLPGGYCASSCDRPDAVCDGACVATAQLGELCAKRCTRDADCRTDEGYVCDPQWNACLVPHVAAIVPRQCPARSAPRTTAFDASEPWPTPAPGVVSQHGPSAVLADDGGIVTLFAARNGAAASDTLGIARVDSAGQRTIDVPRPLGDATHADPHLARDRAGTLYAVTVASTEGARRAIVLATSSDGGATWSTPRAIHDPTDCAETRRACPGRPMVVVGEDPGTTAKLVHVMYEAGEHGLRVRTSRDGGTTFTAGPIALAGSYGNAATSSDGRLHLVAINGGPLAAYGSAHHAIEYAVSSDGGATFRPPVTVSGTDEVLPFLFANPSIAVDDRRRWLYIAYVRGGRDAAWDIVIAASKDGGTTWKRTTLAGDGCAIHMVPNLALDPATGTLHVAYYDSEGAPGRFVHASCAPGARKCSVHGAINSLPFAALSTAPHTSRSVGEHEALLVDAKRRVLHAVWAQTIEEAGKPVTRLFHARARLKK